jgi:hypothetical protein
MEPAEWQSAVGRINDDIRGLIRAQQVRAEIDEELQHRSNRRLKRISFLLMPLARTLAKLG